MELKHQMTSNGMNEVGALCEFQGMSFEAPAVVNSNNYFNENI